MWPTPRGVGPAGGVAPWASVVLIGAVPVYPVAVLLKASFAVTLTLLAMPATIGVVNPATVKVAASAGVTVMPVRSAEGRAGNEWGAGSACEPAEMSVTWTLPPPLAIGPAVGGPPCRGRRRDVADAPGGWARGGRCALGVCRVDRGRAGVSGRRVAEGVLRRDADVARNARHDRRREARDREGRRVGRVHRDAR